MAYSPTDSAISVAIPCHLHLSDSSSDDEPPDFRSLSPPPPHYLTLGTLPSYEDVASETAVPARPINVANAAQVSRINAYGEFMAAGRVRRNSLTRARYNDVFNSNRVEEATRNARSFTRNNNRRTYHLVARNERSSLLHTPRSLEAGDYMPDDCCARVGRFILALVITAIIILAVVLPYKASVHNGVKGH